MRVFISSVIQGFEQERDAVSQATNLVGHQAVKAEDFGARPETPQRACINEVRRADVVVLVLGTRYGFVDPELGVSATEQEFDAAMKAGKPVLVFVGPGNPEEAQSTFRTRVQDWSRGRFTESFEDPQDLKDRVVRALVRVSNDHAAIGSVDPAESFARLDELVSAVDLRSSGTLLEVGVACTPAVLIPTARFDSRLLEDELFDAGIGIGAFRKRDGYRPTRKGDTLLLESRGRILAVGQHGEVVCLLPASTRLEGFGLEVLIEEDVQKSVQAGLALGASVLEAIDEDQQVSLVTLRVVLHGADYRPWVTADEARRLRNGFTAGKGEKRIVVKMPAIRQRGSLRAEAAAIVAEVCAQLRRATWVEQA